jgi:pilus assembly protein Flp/PilA
MMLRILAYLQDLRGATAIEYGLIAAGIAVAIVAIVMLIGDELNVGFTVIEENLSEANTQ